MAPSKSSGVEIELPDFDELFGRIQSVSPLAKIAIEQQERITDGTTSHFDDMDKATDRKYNSNFEFYAFGL